MEIMLVRHARPVAVTGTDREPDPPLGDLGQMQAQRLSRCVSLSERRISAIYTSPLLRARQTVEPVSKMLGIEPIVDDDLRELDLGYRHYVPVEELGADSAQVIKQIREPVAGGGANPLVTEFRHRALTAIDRIGKLHPDATALAVCHIGVINAVATAILGISELVAFEIDYVSITRVHVADTGMRSVSSVNETLHLRCGNPKEAPETQAAVSAPTGRDDD